MNDRITLIDIDNDSEEPVNFNAVKDIEQMLLLYPDDKGLSCIRVVHNMLIDIQAETKQKYFSQMIWDLSPDTKAYWIVHAFLADTYNSINDEKAIQIYSKVIDALKDGEQLQLHCYHKRGIIYFWQEDYTNALADFAKIAQHSDLSSQNARSYHTTDPFVAKQHITDMYIKRAKLFMKNKEYGKALDDYSAAIDSGITGRYYTLKEAFTARIEIYKIQGEMEKASVDSLKMSELKEKSVFDDLNLDIDDLLSFSPDAVPARKYEIMDGI
jgi:tetratricopeptide (TPR) repeat protein